MSSIQEHIKEVFIIKSNLDNTDGDGIEISNILNEISVAMNTIGGFDFNRKGEFKYGLTIEKELLENIPIEFLDENNEWLIFGKNYFRNIEKYSEKLIFKKNLVNSDKSLDYRLYPFDNDLSNNNEEKIFNANMRIINRINKSKNEQKLSFIHSFHDSNGLSSYNQENLNKKQAIIGWMFSEILEEIPKD